MSQSSESLTLKYYGLERDYEGKGEWIACGIVGATSDVTYSEVREALSILENFRVRPIEDKNAWADVFKAGKIIEFKTLCTAILILCTK
ncbi:MAG: hypothetical protein WC315_00275 [Candidatus Omnitrophota bacterium]|jgi:hypothetical protein